MKKLLFACIFAVSASHAGNPAVATDGAQIANIEYEPISVELIDSMGSDLTVVNAARVSFSKESGWEDDEAHELKKRDKKLISYLARHNHWTPFGHATATFRIKAPLFVARQLVKHTVGFCWNEVSRRYVSHAPTFYQIKKWRGRPKNMKQGSGGDPSVAQKEVVDTASMAEQVALEAYNKMIEDGVAPEQARAILPQSMMTEWYWTGSLAAWARMCFLRLGHGAQQETSEVAQLVSNHMKNLFPVSWNALMA